MINTIEIRRVADIAAKRYLPLLPAETSLRYLRAFATAKAQEAADVMVTEEDHTAFVEYYVSIFICLVAQQATD